MQIMNLSRYYHYFSYLLFILLYFLNSPSAFSVQPGNSDLDMCERILSLGGEWGEITTVVIGNPVGARFPHEIPHMLEATLPAGKTLEEIISNPGRPFDPTLLAHASAEIDQVIMELKQLGIQVLQPNINEDFFANPIVQNAFRANSGFYAAMPRDNLLLLPPNLVVISPMAWRSRYREHEAYQDILRELQKIGLRVIEAPRPSLSDNTYVTGWRDQQDGIFRPVIRNEEPLFDAADFLRFGRHIIGQLSHVTNKKGIQWIRSVLGQEYRLHIIEFADEHPMHVDATLLPLSVGKVLVNPERVPKDLRDVLEDTLLHGWEMIEVPRPNEIPRETPLYLTSQWINMNILVGNRWAFVEKEDLNMAALLKAHGFEAIPFPFQHFQALGGSFHCSTLDLRRSEDIPSDDLTSNEDLHIFFDQKSRTYKTEPLHEFLAEN